MSTSTTLAQRLSLLPGVLVSGMGIAPALQVRPVLLIGAARFQQRKPLRRSTDSLTGIGRLTVHRSTSRQCS